VPWFIICVRLGPSTPGDYVRARVLVPRNPGVTEVVSEECWLYDETYIELDNPYLLTLLWFFPKLILIISHLFPLYSDYSYLFFLKTNVDFTLWNPVPKVTIMYRRPNLKEQKNQNYFYTYLRAAMFVLMILVWFGSLIECDGLWSNVHNYIYIYIMLIKLTRQTRLSLIKISSLTISISS
jgi:hypothetical protein